MTIHRRLPPLIAILILLFSLTPPAQASYPDGVQKGVARMLQLGLIGPAPDGNMVLNGSLTRAQLTVMIIRAMGQADQAPLLHGAPAYPDTATHWASGEIALAKNLTEQNGWSLALPDGGFHPNDNVTAGQVVAFLMATVGVKRDASRTYPDSVLYAAQQAGMITADDVAMLKGVANSEATRGLAFYLMDEVFAGYQLPTGKTVYQTYEMPNPPVLSVDKVGATTGSSVTITGKVSDASAKVWVNSLANTVAVGADGRFSYKAENLAFGENAFVIGAADLVNNVTTVRIAVTRTTGAVASIEAGDIYVAAGQSVAFAPVVKDAGGNVIPGAAITVTSDLGTYAGGQFTAGARTGTGTATIVSGMASRTVAVTASQVAPPRLGAAPSSDLVVDFLTNQPPIVPEGPETAANRMVKLKLITGRADGSLDLGGPITRAELFTTMVRAFGRQNEAAARKYFAGYTDIRGHWAAGYIAVAQDIVAQRTPGSALGMPDGSLAPDSQVTPPQVVATLMKFLGINPAQGLWPNNYLDAALKAGLISGDDRAAILSTATATRGLVFYLVDKVCYNYRLPEGGTLYTKYVDTSAPSIRLSSQIPASTADTGITLSGSVDASDLDQLWVQSAGWTRVIPHHGGAFNVPVHLEPNQSNLLTIVARDSAGNLAMARVSVTQAGGSGEADSLWIHGLTLKAGQCARVPAVLTDARGYMLLGFTPEGSSSLGTFSGGIFCAGNRVGTDSFQVRMGGFSGQTTLTVNPAFERAIGVPAGRVLIADDGTFLGRWNSSATDPLSICNPAGTYGSPESPWSIWNKDGNYGAVTAGQSPFNPSTLRPPVVKENGKPLYVIAVGEMRSKLYQLSPVNLCQNLRDLGF